MGPLEQAENCTDPNRGQTAMSDFVLAIDPGPERSGWVLFDPKCRRILDHGITSNTELLVMLTGGRIGAAQLVIERIVRLGMPVGQDIFDTCVWIGRLQQGFDGPCELITRREVKLNLCGDMRAKDGNIRQVLIDRFGPGKDRAVGKKKDPGPLYGIRRDEWSALALAVVFADREAHVQASTLGNKECSV